MGDAVDGAVAVLAVAAALVRYTAETAAHSRPALSRPPLSSSRTVLRWFFHGAAARVLAHPVSAAEHAVAVAADQVIPGMARAVLARLDIAALVQDYVDLYRLAAMLDVDAVVARVDIAALLDRIDVDAIAARLDLDTLVDKVDVSRVVDRVDLDAVVARVDLDRVVDRVDLDRAVGRVDVDGVIARIDVSGLARYIVEEIDLPTLLRTSSGSVTAEVVRGVRDQGMDADRAVERVVDRLLRRAGRRTATGATGGGADHDAG
jgi:hypothetical protein